MLRSKQHVRNHKLTKTKPTCFVLDRTPCEGLSKEQIIVKVMKEEPVKIPKLPLPWFDDTVGRCLDKNPSTRATIPVRLANQHLQR